MALQKSSALQKLLFYILLFSCISLEVYSKKLASRKRKASKFKRFQLFGYLSIGFFICLFAPALFSFINALRLDPAVPKLFKAAIDVTRKKSLSFLGTQDPIINHDHPE